VIGGAAGAFPPMVGWAAVTGDVSLAPVLMFLIIFLWTPPHFWALGLLKSDDYARAGVPMLPVVAGPDATRKQILIYSVILAPVGLTPTVFGFAGHLYGVVALACGAVMLHLAWRVYRDRIGVAAASAAKRLFAFSLVYVFVLFAALLTDNLLARLGIAL
jgi:protoheme IX farnesyltransferase